MTKLRHCSKGSTTERKHVHCVGCISLAFQQATQMLAQCRTNNRRAFLVEALGNEEGGRDARDFIMCMVSGLMRWFDRVGSIRRQVNQVC